MAVHVDVLLIIMEYIWYLSFAGVSQATMGIKKEDAEASKKEIKENRDKDESQMSSTEKVPHGSNEPLRRSPRKRKCVPDTIEEDEQSTEITVVDENTDTPMTKVKTMPRRSPRIVGKSANKVASDGTEGDTEGSDRETEPEPPATKRRGRGGKLKLNKPKKDVTVPIVVASSPEGM